MPQPKIPSISPAGAERESPAPASAVQVKTKPILDRRLEQIAADCDAGLVSPDEAVEQMIEANLDFYGSLLSPQRLAELDVALRDFFDRPEMLVQMGRSK